MSCVNKVTGYLLILNRLEGGGGVCFLNKKGTILEYSFILPYRTH